MHIQADSPGKLVLLRLDMLAVCLRFSRRIHQTELSIASILNHAHRLMIRMKRRDI